MDLDTVEAGVDRRTGSLAVILDDAGDFGGIERARLGGVGKAAGAVGIDQIGLGFGNAIGRGNWLAIVRLQRRVRDAADMSRASSVS